ncbi:hypothetical protein TNCV_321081 [Trichonephila clavipes]|nr:hypothetical protein TNCV_321081 [Trichonephila clavipes]
MVFNTLKKLIHILGSRKKKNIRTLEYPLASYQCVDTAWFAKCRISQLKDIWKSCDSLPLGEAISSSTRPRFVGGKD